MPPSPPRVSSLRLWGKISHHLTLFLDHSHSKRATGRRVHILRLLRVHYSLLRCLRQLRVHYHFPRCLVEFRVHSSSLSLIRAKCLLFLVTLNTLSRLLSLR